MPDRRAFVTRLAALWAATVAHRPARPPTITARSTALFQHPDGRRNLVRVAVSGVDAPAARARLLDRRGALVGTAGLLPAGANGLAGELWVPLGGPAEFRVDVEVGRDRVARGAVRLAPPRRWTVHLVTLLPSRAPQDRALASLDAVLAQLNARPGHRWTPTDARQVLRFFAERPAAAADALATAMRDGRVGLPGLSGDPLTSLLDHDTLARVAEPSARLARERGVAYLAAFTHRVSGQAASFPLALSASGVRYLMSLVDDSPDAAVDAARPLAASPQLFWWEGPDGSRVLQWIAPRSLTATRLGLGGSVDDAAHTLSEWLLSDPGLAAAVWPYDVACLPWVAPDGGALPPDAALDTVEELRRRYAYPRIIPGRAEEFFREVEERHGTRVPVRRGGTGWPATARPAAGNLARLRAAQLAARAADLVAVWDWRTEPLDGSARERVRQRAEERRGVWSDLQGAAAALDPPAAENATRSLDDAWRAAWRQVDEGLSRIGRLTDRGRGRVIFNASPWDRSDIVRVPGGAGWTLSLGGDDLPTVDLPDGSALCVARSVPGLGYLAYADRPHAAQPVEPEGPALDAAAGGFTVWLDAATGAVASLRGPDGREQVRGANGSGLNQFFLPHSGGPGPATQAVLVAARRERLPGIGVRLTAERRLSARATLVSTVTLYDELPWVDLETQVTPLVPDIGRDVYVAFPFALSDPAVDAEIPLGRTRLERTPAAGPAPAWHAHTHWVWLTAGADGVLWSGPDTPFVTLGEPGGDPTGPGRSTLVTRVETGTAEGQPLSVRFRLSLLPPGDPAEPARRGWAACEPLYVSAPYTNAKIGPLIARDRAVFLAESGALVLAAKPADDGRGMIVRLLDVSGTSRAVGLWPAAWTYRAARRATLVEADIEDLAVEPDGRTAVPLRAWSVAAARLFTP